MSEEWTVRRILDWTTAHFKQHGSDTPRLDAEILLAHARACRRIELYTRFDEPLTDVQRAVMRDLAKRRAKSEPVAYLVGHREFFSLDFRVTPDVLIPRPDTETLVVELIDAAKSLESPRILDLGTGSGCIAIAAAVNLPAAQITATDISEAPLAIARENAETHAVADRVRFLQGDLFAPLPEREQFEVIASNPPYIAESERETLQNDVRRYEPHAALFAGPKGTEVLFRIIDGAPARLTSGGTLLLEISPEQDDAVRTRVESTGAYEDIRVIKDAAGLFRVVRARKLTAAC
ncbi:MAG TPA: peptide chain release factor N(5)-glutamine methyltransferase [Planctomycetaceae bacterium]|nr:peptide chain release factor N(5)-glutamine methyltransferase [Planctomycetaceae bacterium]